MPGALALIAHPRARDKDLAGLLGGTILVMDRASRHPSVVRACRALEASRHPLAGALAQAQAYDAIPIAGPDVLADLARPAAGPRPHGSTWVTWSPR